MSDQTIELDCAPGYPRPDDLIKGVIEGTGLESRDDVSRIMGNFTWDYSDVSSEVWAKARLILKKKITELYNKGTIRYGSW